MIWDYPPNYRYRVERMLTAAAEPIGSVLALAHRSAQASLLAPVNWLRALHKRWVYLAVVLLVLVALSLSPYRVATDCTVEPLERRFVVAPFEGVFEKSLVRPGDLVEQNQVLARDGRPRAANRNRNDQRRMRAGSQVARYEPGGRQSGGCSD